MKDKNYTEMVNEQEEDFPETGNNKSFLRNPLGFFMLFMVAVGILIYLLFRFHFIG